MNKVSSIERITRTNLIDQTKLKLNEINKIENYFNQEIKERSLISKKSSKYVSIFDYMHKMSIVQQVVEYLLFLLQLLLELP